MSRDARYITLLLCEMARHRALAKLAECEVSRDGHLEVADACWAGALALGEEQKKTERLRGWRRIIE